MERKTSIVYSPIHARGYKGIIKQMKLLDRMQKVTGMEWECVYDDDFRLTIRPKVVEVERGKIEVPKMGWGS